MRTEILSWGITDRTPRGATLASWPARYRRASTAAIERMKVRLGADRGAVRVVADVVQCVVLDDAVPRYWHVRAVTVETP